jgi:hypothetical protein
MREAGEPDQPDLPADALARRAHAAAEHIERQCDVRLDRAPRQERRILKGDPELAAATDRRRALAIDRDAAGIRRFQTRSDPQVVDLPQPEGPISAVSDPAAQTRSMPSRTVSGSPRRK